VLNPGSATLKWTLFDTHGRVALQTGERTWHATDVEQRAVQIREALAGVSAVDAVGHRVVHGGTRFAESVVVGPDVRAALEPIKDFDAGHMGPALAAIDAVSREFPSTLQVAVFDTAFHACMPQPAAGYGLPFEWSERWGLRRFGFHGISVQYSLTCTHALLGRTPERIVVCHLGGGCSVTALRAGKSIDTTMGFSPLEGVVMTTRSGSVDPGLLLYLQSHRGLSVDELLDALQNRSGLLGMSGVSADLRDVLAAADAGSARARLAYDRLVWSLRRAVGSMTGVLDGIEAIVFTGGIGENSARVRSDVSDALTWAGLRLNADANQSATAGDRVISAPDSSISALVVRAREDLVVLDEVIRLARTAASGP